MKYLLLKVLGLFNLMYDKMHSARAFYQKNNFAKCGINVSVGRKCDFFLPNIYCGSNVIIGSRSSFIASIAKIYIGNYVMFGPSVTIRGGDHRTDIKGRYMIQIKEDEKLPENDKDVIIEDDVWVGCNVTILKGVKIGRGSIVAAGSLVNKSCLPYSIIGGVPAKLLRVRWENMDDIIEHESLLYNNNERLTDKQIEDIFNNYSSNI